MRWSWQLTGSQPAPAEPVAVVSKGVMDKLCARHVNALGRTPVLRQLVAMVCAVFAILPSAVEQPVRLTARSVGECVLAEGCFMSSRAVGQALDMVLS